MSSRIVFCIILFGSVLLFQGFSASYTSFLSVTTQLKPFETVEQLYSDTDYKVGTREGVAAAAMFRTIHEPWSGKLIDERWEDSKGLEVAIEKMKKSTYGFMDATQTMLYELS